MKILLLSAVVMFGSFAWGQSPPELNIDDYEMTRRTLTNDEKMDMYLRLIENFIGWAETSGNYVDSESLEAGGGFFEGKGRGVDWSRGNSNMAISYALLLTERPEQKLFTIYDIPREQLMDHARKAIRSLCIANKNFSGHQPSDRTWGGPAWQTGLSFIGCAWAAHLLEKQLDRETLDMVREVAGIEADLMDKEIPNRRFRDTGAEDCAWNTAFLAFVANKYADDERAEHWDYLAKKWGMNAISIGPDSEDETILDGRPVKQWVVSENLHPDLTLENHGFWSVGYQVSSQHFGEAAAAYKAFGNEVPEVYFHHSREIWDNVTGVLFLWDGSMFFPHGQDWAWKVYSYVEYPAWQATFGENPYASAYESRAMQMILGRQMAGKTGELLVFDFGNQTVKPKRWSFAYLMHKYAPSKSLPFEKADEHSHGVYHYEFNKIMVHRAPEKCVSVSWHPHSQAIFIFPEGDSTFTDPPFFFPNDRFSATPQIKIAGAEEGHKVAVKPELINYETLCDNEGMSVSLKRTFDDVLEQYITVVSMPDESVLYCTAFHALKDASVEISPLFAMRGDAPPGFEEPIVQTRGDNWLNISDHIGFISIDSLPENIPAEQIYVTDSQMLETNADQWFLQTAVVAYPRQKQEETEAFAESLSLLKPAKKGRFALKFKSSSGDNVVEVSLTEGQCLVK